MPAAPGNELLSALIDLRLSSGNLVDGELVKRPRVLDVLQRLLQILQLPVDHGLGLLGALDSLGLESLNGLDLPAHIVGLGLEGREALLDFVNDGGVLEDRAVVAEVDGLGLLRENGDLAARVVVALLEGLEGGGGLAFETELGADCGPVELEGCAALWTGGLVFLLAGERVPLGTARPRGGRNCASQSSQGYRKRG